MLAVMRVRGRVNVGSDMQDTMNMLGLRKVNTVAVFPHSDIIMGMVHKVENYVTWGTLSEATKKRLEKLGKMDKNTYQLAPPKGGFRAIKKPYPKGDLGNRGDKINELIEKMLKKE